MCYGEPLHESRWEIDTASTQFFTLPYPMAILSQLNPDFKGLPCLRDRRIVAKRRVFIRALPQARTESLRCMGRADGVTTALTIYPPQNFCCDGTAQNSSYIIHELQIMSIPYKIPQNDIISG